MLMLMLEDCCRERRCLSEAPLSVEVVYASCGAQKMRRSIAPVCSHVTRLGQAGKRVEVQSAYVRTVSGHVRHPCLYSYPDIHSTTLNALRVHTTYAFMLSPRPKDTW